MTILNKDVYVRYGVACNSNTPEEILSLLATDEDSDVRLGVARNPNASEEILLLIKAREFQLKKPLLKLI